MNGLRQYIISVLSAAMICAIVIKISEKNQLSANVIRLVATAFLLITVLAPFLNFTLSDFNRNFSLSKIDGTQIAEQASNDALQETALIIKEHTKAYIEKKAESYGADISATISISEPTSLVPDGIKIEGNISPYIKTILTTIINDDLGIPEDKQIWN